MESTFLSHSAIFLLSVLLFFDLSFVSSTPNISILFDNWCDEHGKDYSSEEEKSYRRKVFEDNYAFITQHNEMGNSTYTLALNEFADLTHQEFKASRLGLSAAAAIDHLNKTKLQEPVLVREIPDSIDWSLKGAVTEVKNQGRCDAPWAFAVIGAIEGINEIVTGDLVRLSEQELIDCDTYNHGCASGGLMDNAYKFVIEKKGIHTEEDYPYYGQDGVCYQELQTRMVSIDGYTDVPPNNEELLLQSVAAQPVSVGLCASSQEFQFYHWGVFTGPCSNSLDHAVLIVGYDTSDDGMDFWIAKNSWGRNWGIGGYLLLQRNTGISEGLCGINMMASYPIKTTPNPPLPPEPTYCNIFYYCPIAETCCCDARVLGICFTWSCCPLDSAVCCEDRIHCCPHDYPICDLKRERCLKDVGNTTTMEAAFELIQSSRKSASWPSFVHNWNL